MGYSSISEVLEAFNNKKVLVIGDVMIDAYIYGSVKRISPEAPVPVVSVNKREKRLGGAANVALNIQSLGAQPLLCALVGDDPEGNEFTDLMESQQMTTEGITKSHERMTTVKHRVISSSQHLLRIDSETENNLSSFEKNAFKEKLDVLIPQSDLIIFEDYDKGLLDQEIISYVINKARKLGILTAVDPKKKNFNFYEACTLFKPNLKELKEGLGLDIQPGDQKAVGSAVKTLKRNLGFENALITLSEHGVYFQSEKEQGTHPAHLRSISDVSGAGDTVISIAALALSLNIPLSIVSELANLGGGIVCEYQGVVPIDKQRLESEALKSDILKNFG